MDVSQFGEFGLISRIRKGLAGGRGVVRGIGDDAAVLSLPEGRVLLATCDALVEGVHFLPAAKAAPRKLGEKAAAVNLSDMAAMGGEPAFFLISLGLPKDTPVEFVDGLYKGLSAKAGQFQASLVGGNVSQNQGGVFVDVFLLGHAEEGRLLYRSTARAGDWVVVSGNPGESAAGLWLLMHPETIIDNAIRHRLIKTHQNPEPRVALGQGLAASGKVTAALDVSDGLAKDLGHICEESSLGAVLFEDRIPVSEDLAALAKAVGKDSLDFALFGGEDYELLFTVPEEHAARLCEELSQKHGIPLTPIGRMEEGRGVRFQGKDGKTKPLSGGGWDHLGSEKKE